MSIDQTKLVVTSSDMNSWYISRSGGYFVDWAKLRILAEGKENCNMQLFIVRLLHRIDFTAFVEDML